MEKKLVLLLSFVNGIFTFSQVGINTATPSATLDIVSKGNSYATKALEVNNSSTLEMVTVLDNGNVGIGTPNPSAQLHTTGTVKMEGLGTAPGNTKIMTTDAGGNVTTRLSSSLLPQVLAGANGTDAITTSQTISSINNVPAYTNNLASRNFTVSQNSLVNFSYSVDVINIVNAAGVFFNDGVAKQIGVNLIWKSLPSGSSIVANSLLCTSAIPFTNGGLDYVTGSFYPSNNCSVILSPGSYTVELQGFVNAADNNQGIRATFGGNSFDRFDITATTLQ